MDLTRSQQPLVPRRAFLAAGLSAVLAGAAVSLAVLGGLSAPKTASFQYSRGLSLVAGDEARLRGFLASALPDERVKVTITGHTSAAGDAAANLSLSEERAASVLTMAQDMGIAPERITALGLGSASALPKLAGESERAYQSRQARVEVSLQMRR